MERSDFQAAVDRWDEFATACSAVTWHFKQIRQSALAREGSASFDAVVRAMRVKKVDFTRPKDCWSPIEQYVSAIAGDRIEGVQYEPCPSFTEQRWLYASARLGAGLPTIPIPVPLHVMCVDQAWEYGHLGYLLSPEMASLIGIQPQLDLEDEDGDGYYRSLLAGSIESGVYAS